MKYPAYPVYKNTDLDWLGRVPQQWEMKQLKWAVTFQRGHDLPDDSREAGTVPVVSSGGISGYHNVACASGPGIVTGRYGTIGEFELVHGDFWPLNTTLYSVDLHGNNATFLRYMLQNLAPLFILNSLKSAVPGVDRNDIHPILIALPSLPEQHAIADYLDRETAQLDALVAAKERLLELLAEKRRALITRAVTRGLDPTAPLRNSGLPWLGEIPAHWEAKRVKYLFTLITDPAPEDNNFELLALYTDIGVRPRKELEARGNKSTTTDNYWMVRPGDLVVNKLLAWMGAFGVSDYEGVTSPAYDILRPAAEIDPKYYHYLFRCGICFPEFRRRSTGIMDMRLRLYFDHFGDMRVPLPPLEEQHAIIANITVETAKLDALREATERTIGLLKERRAALIAAAVTGKIAIPEYTEDNLPGGRHEN